MQQCLLSGDHMMAGARLSFTLTKRTCSTWWRQETRTGLQKLGLVWFGHLSHKKFIALIIEHQSRKLTGVSTILSEVFAFLESNDVPSVTTRGNLPVKVSRSNLSFMTSCGMILAGRPVRPSGDSETDDTLNEADDLEQVHYFSLLHRSFQL